ncbi:hypothetical protein HHK36_017810 [Tetracentron sinense]|uniref:Uncharacterized protein n=1 Tax=Tetracentron sinense TaxID=13715 RepID=A0A835DCY0_TETSI|nr:hypothetical protein HHK36_017810 [Tetracentron sinense]
MRYHHEHLYRSQSISVEALKHYTNVVPSDQLLPLIESVNLLDHIVADGAEPKQLIATQDGKEEHNPVYSSWKREDRLLKNLIVGTLSEQVHSLVVGLDCARDVWRCLEESFAGASKEREVDLILQLHSIKKGNSNVPDFLQKFKTLCDELAAIQKPVSDDDKVAWAITGLDSSYDALTNAILARPPLPSFTQFVTSLIAYDRRMQSRSSSKDSVNDSQAYVGQRQNRGNRNNRGWTPNRHSGIGNTNFNSRGRGDISCQICGKGGHNALRCWNRFNHSYQAEEIPQALAAMSITDPQDPDWIPDTGASSHMTNNLDEKCCMFEFDSRGFVIKDQKSRKVLARGIRDGNLYSLGQEKGRALFSSRHRKTFELVWHQRLGHPHEKVVHDLEITTFAEWLDNASDDIDPILPSTQVAVPDKTNPSSLQNVAHGISLSDDTPIIQDAAQIDVPILASPPLPLLPHSNSHGSSDGSSPSPVRPPSVLPTTLPTSQAPSPKVSSPVLHQADPGRHLSLNKHPMRTRGKDKAGLIHSSVSNTPTEPQTVKSALQHPSWTAAMKEELNALRDNSTWTLVPRTPEMNVVALIALHKNKQLSESDSPEMNVKDIPRQDPDALEIL